MKKTILSLIAVLTLSVSAFAADGEAPKTMFNGSTNIQIFYDFATDRQCVTTTLEGFYNDPWGNTFFFIDHDYNPVGSKLNPNNDPLTNPMKFISGTYWEIARCLNFWHNSPIKDLSLQVEYNGGVYSAYGINHAFLAGFDYFLHSSDFKNTFNFKLLYKHILYDQYGYDALGNAYPMDWGKRDANGNPILGEPNHQTVVPLQFTFVWGMQDLFGVPGLRFNGFLDVWGQEHYVYDTKWNKDGTVDVDWANGKLRHFVMITEPQIWYSVGQHFGCPNLNVGTEIEMSFDFGTAQGFWCRPCLGVKWVF